MRTVPQPVIDQMDNDRTIGARLTIRDTLLTFDEVNINYVDYAMSGQAHSYDAANHGTGIVRVANVNGSLWYQYVSDLNGIWPTWIDTGRALINNSNPGVTNGRVFYHKSNGNWAYANITNGVIGIDQQRSFIGYVPASFAPVNTDEVYLHFGIGFMEAYTGTISYRKISTSETIDWRGGIYGGELYRRGFDAVRLDGIDYIFFTDKDERRTFYLSTRDAQIWSEVKPVLPLDVVDDTSLFRIGGATIINNQIALGGILRRQSGSDMQIYTFGPNFTLGRDLFVTNKGVNSFNYSHGGLGYSAPAYGCKMHLIDNELWYIGIAVAFKAEATMMIGYDNPSKKLVTTDVTSIQMNSATNMTTSLVVDVPSSLDDPVLKSGADLQIETAYNNQFANIGHFVIDTVLRTREEGGRGQSIVSRSNALQRLSSWQSDASLDYWSQAKQSSNPAAYTDVIRASGKWDEQNGEMFLEDLNSPGILYATARASRGMTVQARFRELGQDYPSSYGVILNYHRESRAEAAERLGKPIDDITEDDYGHNGIGVLWERDIGDGNTGISIFDIESSNWVRIIGYPVAAPSYNTQRWIRASFHDGQIAIKYRNDTNTNWVDVVSDHRYFREKSPWKRDELGRGGIVVINHTPHSLYYNFESGSPLIPVEETAPFPTSGTILVDGEKISINGKSGQHALAPQNLEICNRYTQDGAPHDNPYQGPFNGFDVWALTVGDALSHDIFNNYTLVAVAGTGKGRVFKIVDYDYSAPTHWVPTGTYTPPEVWTDYIGDPEHGYWITPYRRRIFVEDDPDGIFGAFDFNTGQADTIAHVTPALSILERGVDETNITSHPGGTAHIVLEEPAVTVDRFDVFSNDEDISFEEMATEIARKAGVMNVSGEKLWSGLSSHGAGWNNNNAVLANPIEDRENFIVKFRRNTNVEMGVAYRLNRNGDVFSGGKIITVNATYIRLYHYNDTSPVIIERIGHGVTLGTTFDVKISVYKNFASVWIDGRHMVTFVDNDPIYGQWAGFVTNGAGTATIDWPELDTRVDNFILDMGQTGDQLLGHLIGEKRVYFHDDQNGHLRIFRNRTTVNTSVPYELSLEKGVMHSSAMATRVRLEGAEAVEEIDYDLLKQHGNIFALINSSELDTIPEFRREALKLLEDASLKKEQVSLRGAADPRLEPQDIFVIDTLDGVEDLIIERLNYRMEINQSNALFDMNGEALRSDIIPSEPDLTQRAYPFGIESSEAFGSPVLQQMAGPDQDINAVGISSGEVFGLATISLGSAPAQSLFPLSIPSGESFGQPGILTGDVNIHPFGIESAEAFGLASIGLSVTGNIYPIGISSEEAFGSPSIATGPVNIEATGMASEEAFGLAIIATGELYIQAQGIASEEAFGLSSLTVGDTDIQAVGIPSEEAFGTPIISTGELYIQAIGIASDEAFGLPSLTVEDADIQAIGIASEEAFGTPVISTGELYIQAQGIPSDEAFGAVSVEVGAVSIEPAGIPSEEAFGLPTVGEVAEPVYAIITWAELETPEPTAGITGIYPTGIPSEEAFGAPAITVGEVDIEAAGIPSEEAFGAPAITVGEVDINTTGISSAEEFGLATITQDAGNITTKLFSFDVDAEGWTAYPAGSVVMSHEIDELSGNGYLRARLAGKNLNPGTSYWEWYGTWEELGVPPNTTVVELSIDGNYLISCTEWSTGAAGNNSGPFELRDNQLIGTISSASRDYEGVDSWSSVPHEAAIPLNQSSSLRIRLRLSVSLATGNSNQAVVAIGQDDVLLKIEYSA